MKTRKNSDGFDRRTFLREVSGSALAAPLLASIPAFAAKAIPASVMNRIGITTVSFRERFKTTRGKGTTKEPDLNLLTAPAFIAKELGIHNVEIWSNQFEDQSLDYCRQIKEAAAKAGCRITNIQVDGPIDVSDPDPGARAKSIAAAKQWVDRAKAVGAPHLRINTGGRPGQVFDVNVTAASFRELTNYAKSLGLKMLIENHVGFSMNIDNVVAILKAVNDPFCRALADFGNSLATSLEDRIAGVKKMLPYLEFVSAKAMQFDDQYRHTSFDVSALVRTIEQSGWRGIYSIELWTPENPPADPVRAARTIMQTIADVIQQEA